MQTLQFTHATKVNILWQHPSNSTSVNAAQVNKPFAKVNIKQFTRLPIATRLGRRGKVGGAAGSGHDLPQVEIACHKNRTCTQIQTNTKMILALVQCSVPKTNLTALITVHFCYGMVYIFQQYFNIYLFLNNNQFLKARVVVYVSHFVLYYCDSRGPRTVGQCGFCECVDFFPSFFFCICPQLREPEMLCRHNGGRK